VTTVGVAASSPLRSFLTDAIDASSTVQVDGRVGIQLDEWMMALSTPRVSGNTVLLLQNDDDSPMLLGLFILV
jgi:hypothetical protein